MKEVEATDPQAYSGTSKKAAVVLPFSDNLYDRVSQHMKEVGGPGTLLLVCRSCVQACSRDSYLQATAGLL